MTATRILTHEVRFFDPKPRAIQGLAYESKSQRLAVVRCNSESEDEYPAVYFLEIWNVQDAPALEFKVHLPLDWRNSVEAVCWRSSRLVYVVGMHGHVLLIDIETGRISKSAAAVSGPIWCIALNTDNSCLAAGTEDGHISLFNVEDDDMLEYTHCLDPKGSRVLSLCWHPTKNLLVSSGRGRIWLWDVVSKSIKMEMRPVRKGKAETIVSSVLLLKNDVVVSGDSSGCTIFWDSLTGTPITTFAAHKAGVLSLVLRIFPDGHERVVSSGMDPVITSFRESTNQDGSATWLQTYDQFRYHTHDVRALCIAGKYLVSGGQDSYLCLLAGGPKDVLKIPPNTHVSAAAVRSSASPKVPLLFLQNTTKIELWQLSPQVGRIPDPGQISPADYAQLLSFSFGKGREMLTVASFSKDAQWFAVSTFTHTKVYHVALPNDLQNHPDMNIIPAKGINGALNRPAKALAFDDRGNLFVADEDCVYVCAVEWRNDVGQQSALVVRKHHVIFLSEGDAVRILAVSPSGRYVGLVTNHKKFRVLDCQTPDNSEIDIDEVDNSRRNQWKCAEGKSSSVILNMAILETPRFPHLLVSYADGSIASFDINLARCNVIVEKNGDILSGFVHCSVEGSLAILHNWELGVLLQLEDRVWSLKKDIRFDKHLLRSIFTSGPLRELVNVSQTPSMILNQLPPALAKKVFGV